MIEGIVDLAFLCEDDGNRYWTVVDFKTDRDLDIARTKYAAQLTLYADAISAATGVPARAATEIRERFEVKRSVVEPGSSHPETDRPDRR